MTERAMSDAVEQLADASEELDENGRDADSDVVGDAVEICDDLAEQAVEDGVDDGAEYEFLVTTRDTLADVRDGNDVSDDALGDATAAVKLMHVNFLQVMVEELTGDA